MLASISGDMQHYNEVATVTKQNEHYQPYIISVFYGKELEKLGVSNLKEALSLVPGLDMATDNANIQSPIFRGSNPLASGQSKLFIDGFLVNNVFLDAYSEYLSFPIEMIKRIEVVRGPGSKTDGVNAYAGSINVITYTEDFDGFESNDKILLKAGSSKYKMGGFVKTYKTDDLKIFVDFFYQEDDKNAPSGPDGLSQGVMSIPGLIDNTALSQSGDAPLWLKEYSLGLNLEYQNFSMKARMLEHTQGSAYGINLALPQDKDRVKLPSRYIELGYDNTLNNFDIDIKAGLKYDTFDSKTKLLPDGLQFIDMTVYPSSIVPVTFLDGAYGEHLAEQRTIYQSAYLKYSGFDKHIFTTGYRFIKEETVNMVSKTSNWTTGTPEPFDYTDTYPFFDKNAKRDTLIFSLQDEYQFNSKLNFIYGFNYETTSYIDAGFEPRVSMVYQQDPTNIFKTIYSRSHRNASWQEMFTMNNHARVGSTNLKPERVEAFEAAYIKKFSSDNYLQANIFYLFNKDQIYNSSANPEYRNVVDTDIYGLELEYKGNISSRDQFYLNYSYVDGTSYIKDESTAQSLPNIANHLAKGYYIYNVNNALSLSGIAKYVGSKERIAGDVRDKVKSYTTVDTSLYYINQKDNYSLTLSIKNIFNENVVFPSPPKTYSEDYAQESRNFLVVFTKEF
ncbi:TonB-dependent receptor plug domain-containing protein [bacterium]|nr:TonB-dependent receptor plug domain-containing protein [bacterium]MBU1994315.1 TonB-dependent receptor plug domain-containing protein [bacterium]